MLFVGALLAILRALFSGKSTLPCSKCMAYILPFLLLPSQVKYAAFRQKTVLSD
jgi:hypothetical protein